MVEYLQDDFPRYITLIQQHLLMAAIAITICCLIAIPLGYVCAKSDRVSGVLLAVASILMVIPSLAMFIVLQPFTGIGMLPAVIALIAMGVPILLINTRTGIKGVDQRCLESAYGMGMEKWRVFFQVELPLALPAILNGIRIVVVSIIASATIAAYVSAGGLGFYIKLGFQTARPEIMYIGAITVAVMAVLADAILAHIQRKQMMKVM